MAGLGFWPEAYETETEVDDLAMGSPYVERETMDDRTEARGIAARVRIDGIAAVEDEGGERAALCLAVGRELGHGTYVSWYDGGTYYYMSKAWARDRVRTRRRHSL